MFRSVRIDGGGEALRVDHLLRRAGVARDRSGGHRGGLARRVTSLLARVVVVERRRLERRFPPSIHLSR